MGLVTPDTDCDARAKQPQWVGKAGHTSFDVLAVSLPFEAGEHRRIAVKIVDGRAIECLRVMEVE